MAYIKFKELSKYFDFKEEIAVDKLSDYAKEYVSSKETIIGSYKNSKDYAVFTCFYACISGLFIWKSRGSSGSSIKSTEAFQGGTCKQKC